MGLSLNGNNPFLRNANMGIPQQQTADQTGQSQEMAKISQIQSQYGASCGCAMCTPDANTKANDVMAKVKAENYAHILQHEQAHASAAGSLGGGISIEYDQNGVAVAGHVPISIPGLDQANPEASLSNYQRVRSAALAPGDPSGADLSIASRAQGLIGQAQVLISQKKQKGGASLPQSGQAVAADA